VEKVVGSFLDRLATLVFPAILVALTGAALLWRLGYVDMPTGTPLEIRVQQSAGPAENDSVSQMAKRLEATPATTAFETRLSTRSFWFTFDIPPPPVGKVQAIEFPSRHAMHLVCWDATTLVLLGEANRQSATGSLVHSRAGFAMSVLPTDVTARIVCQSEFRGPAKISVALWSVPELVVAQASHQNTGVMLEAGIGVLAVFMLLTALVNRSALYWMFVGWLLLNMRMAGISAGTDFDLFGYVIPPSWLVAARQWTVCVYYAMTIALFGTLFRAELQQLSVKRPLRWLQFSAVAAVLVCPFVAFEPMLSVLWVATSVGFVVIVAYLLAIFRKGQTRVAAWYAASMVVTLVASMNEVLAASMAQRSFLPGLNSVSAAIASALLASAAVAEHMRLHRLQNKLAQSMLEAAYQDSPVGLFTVGVGQRIVKFNPGFASMVQHLVSGVPNELAQLFDADVVHAIAGLHQSRVRAALEIQTRITQMDTGAHHWFSITASTVDGNIVECSLQDMTERVLATQRLEFLASHDALTGCLNLRGLAHQVEATALKPTALAYFDLDRFKLINDLYGHAAGDNVLKQVAERMAGVLAPTDLLARVGGDEFVIVFADAAMEACASTCNTIVTLVGAAPFQIDNQSFSLEMSGGLVGTEKFGQSPLKDIVSAADTLCRMAKKRADQRLVVMTSDDRFFQQHQDELDLITCFERGETPEGLFLVMQPELSLSRPFDSLNFEILVRLRKPDGSVVCAGTIIEAAEAHGKTAIIDRWVVTTAIDWLERNDAFLGNTQFVGLNLSGGSLNDESFTAELFALFEAHPAALSKVCIEITETVAITDMRNMQKFIDRVRAIGAKVGLDDFGAGYSSFGYLKGLSVDALKLDGSLVRDATRSQAGMAIIAAIGSLVASLGMKSVGEFAEDLPTIKALYDAGIDYAQGYGISKPVEPQRILDADSGADFIEDPEILAFIQLLQRQTESNLPLFGNSMFPNVH
jgi:diguanylate cyclase (GGDEF)-like protein